MTAPRLPEPVNALIHRLETAGFPTYAVGGCVRDHLLGLTPSDFDLCTAALPEQTQAVFADHRLVLAGKKHGTVGVVTDTGVVEITTFRTEGDYSDSRHPGWVAFVPDIGQDLARRDFTVNAMAWSPIRGYADPFGGRADLSAGILRAVGDPRTRFREDALRILRGVRFSVRYRLQPEEETLQAMFALAPLLENLARERVYEELNRLLPLVSARDLLTFAPVLTAAIGELAPTLGFDQHSPHHAYDIYTHTAYVTAAVPPEPVLRWAALLHDIGKVPCFTADENGRGHFNGHAGKSGEMADAVLRSLHAPTALREQVVTLISLHMTPLTADRKLLRRRLSQYGADTVTKLLQLQQADAASKGVAEDREDLSPVTTMLEQLMQEDACLKLTDLAVNGRDMLALGLQGRSVGACLTWLHAQVLDELLPNRAEILRSAAGAWRDSHITNKEDAHE